MNDQGSIDRLLEFEGIPIFEGLSASEPKGKIIKRAGYVVDQICPANRPKHATAEERDVSVSVKPTGSVNFTLLVVQDGELIDIVHYYVGSEQVSFISRVEELLKRLVEAHQRVIVGYITSQTRDMLDAKRTPHLLVSGNELLIKEKGGGTVLKRVGSSTFNNYIDQSDLSREEIEQRYNIEG